jgi:dihydroorotase-like cyclic amidohydrolase
VLQVGADADLVVVDPDREWTIWPNTLHSRSKITPFEGWSVRGGVVATLVRGKVVFQDGEIVGTPIGRWLRPLDA